MPSRPRRAARPPGLEQLEDRCLLSGGPVEYRTIDGTLNNLANPDWGKANSELVRAADPAYADGVSALAGADRPSPREISNLVLAQTVSILNDRRLSDFIWQWGQFLDHDLDLTGAASPAEHADIPIPQGDPQFDPTGTGDQTMPFTRSVYDTDPGIPPGSPRQQMNQITAYIDASNVYGSDPLRAAALRTFQGGRLRTSGDGLLPFNTFGLPNAIPGGADPTQFYLAGDVRANEQVNLTAMHTLFVREHNRQADQLARLHPQWDDEQLYQMARKIVGAEIQVITYNEFLPALFGPYAPSPHGHYEPTVNASILNEFSTALLRVGHTMLSPQVLRVENSGAPDPRGPMSLAGAFFNPSLLTSSHDLGVILKGLASQRMQEVDAKVVDAVRNFLFGPPGAGGLDLASLNLQRGRDHGLPDYNTLRDAFGLPRVTSFAQITSDVSLQHALAAAYGSVDNIDPWVGALAEDHLRGASVGPLLAVGLGEQFRRLRDGDRFWYENDTAFSRGEVAVLRHTTLADVIRRNTGLRNIQQNVFFVRHDARGGEHRHGPEERGAELADAARPGIHEPGTTALAGAVLVLWPDGTKSTPAAEPGDAAPAKTEVPAAVAPALSPLIVAANDAWPALAKKRAGAVNDLVFLVPDFLNSLSKPI